MCSCGATAIFAWIGFILVNAAFLGIISWGNATAWPLGLVLILIYAAALLGAAFYIERRIGTQGEENVDQEAEEAEGQVSSTAQEQQENDGLAGVVTVIYLLFVFAIGTVGLYLAINLFQCGSGGSDGSFSGGSGRVSWIEKENIPQDVKDNIYSYDETSGFAYFPSSGVTWFKENIPQDVKDNIYSYDETSGFAYFPSSGVTWFESRFSDEQNNISSGQYLMSVSGGKSPELLLPVVKYPRLFTKYLNSTCVCGQDYVMDSQEVVYCSSDGSSVELAFNATKDITYIAHMYVSPSPEDKLWIYTNSNNPYGEVIFSVNTNMVTEIHSVKEGFDNNDSCEDFEQESRKFSLMTLFLSCIPVMFTSSFLYQRKNFIPSMVLSFYVGLTGVVATSYLSLHPDVPNDLYDVIKWWLAVSGFALLCLMSYLSLTQRITSAVMSWGIFTFGVSYFAGTMMVIEIFSNFNDGSDWWRWIVINIITFIPLIVVGISLGQMFLLALGAIGLMMDVFRFTTQLDIW
eukprot:CAMPEP_0194349194 /NCGR_PEP_ID=MMETSP0171-20130528/106948_1 /TAXON_ID=218684 /ORGANISM="Corethron pennatum, Strain L29A3" /LENGTH=516 /DNA_ID=CAMNT_0039116613 /DNA_START=186 /DNA_END=1733 /DNA_ORIENTATION=-